MNKEQVLSKAKAFADIIDGKVVDESNRVEVCIKGNVLGFPATVEAIKAGFPFSTSFYVETDVLHERGPADTTFTITITPKVARGITGFLGRLLLIDAHEIPTGNNHFDAQFLAHSDNDDMCKRFVHYPGMTEKISTLQQYTSFRELHIQGGKGLCLIAPANFSSFKYDVARETFSILSSIAQTMSEAF